MNPNQPQPHNPNPQPRCSLPHHAPHAVHVPMLRALLDTWLGPSLTPPPAVHVTLERGGTTSAQQGGATATPFEPLESSACCCSKPPGFPPGVRSSTAYWASVCLHPNLTSFRASLAEALFALTPGRGCCQNGTLLQTLYDSESP